MKTYFFIIYLVIYCVSVVSIYQNPEGLGNYVALIISTLGLVKDSPL